MQIDRHYQKLWYFLFDELLLNLPAEKYNLETVLFNLTQEFFAQLMDTKDSGVDTAR